ncbi:MAG: DUF4058 family protein [Nitrospirae bacterium]|nr:DUF4058 family protein [Nitrospirota bacterium]
MPSPFPGMDPYLENPVWWPDFHHSFITYARDALQPGLRPRYRARISERVYIVEPPQHYYPDIAILREESDAVSPLRASVNSLSSRLGEEKKKETPFPNVNGSNSQFAVAEADNPVIITLPKEAQKQGFIEILHADGAVVSVIEVISPVNKTPPRGLNDYHEKQRQLLESATHLVEIDLLRRGTHAVAVPSELVAEQCATWDYLVCVHRASVKSHRQACYRFEVYPVTIRRRLPRIRVPLRAPDPDIVLPLQAVFVRCYDSGGYEDFVDYNAEPPVPLAPDDALFSDALLREAQRRTES